MYARNSSCCNGCGCELQLDCGSDYLKIDGRAIVLGDDGTWPESVDTVRLLFESVDGCGCNAACSLEIEGSVFEAGCNYDWPTASSTIVIRDCCGWGAGYAYRNNGCQDPAATVQLKTCDGAVVGLIYPAPVPGKATTRVNEGCTAPAALVGYALDKIKSVYRMGGCTAYPGEQRTAWFDITAAQTRAIGKFAGRYKLLGILPSGSTVVLAEGAVL